MLPIELSWTAENRSAKISFDGVWINFADSVARQAATCDARASSGQAASRDTSCRVATFKHQLINDRRNLLTFQLFIICDYKHAFNQLWITILRYCTSYKAFGLFDILICLQAQTIPLKVIGLYFRKTMKKTGCALMEYSRLQIVTAFGLMDGFKDSCGQDLKKKNAILSGCAHMESDIWAWGAHSWSYEQVKSQGKATCDLCPQW